MHELEQIRRDMMDGNLVRAGRHFDSLMYCRPHIVGLRNFKKLKEMEKEMKGRQVDLAIRLASIARILTLRKF